MSLQYHLPFALQDSTRYLIKGLPAHISIPGISYAEARIGPSCIVPCAMSLSKPSPRVPCIMAHSIRLSAEVEHRLWREKKASTIATQAWTRVRLHLVVGLLRA